MKKKEKQQLFSMTALQLDKRVHALEAEIIKGKHDRKDRAKRKEIAVAKTILSMKHL